MFRTFSHPRTSAWSGHDLVIVAVWGVVGAAVALRRFESAPNRA